jgi:hypothetical protein
MALSMFLLKTKYNWADEMDVEGFCLMRPAEYEYLLREIRAIQYPIDWNIGTNQYIEFESAEEILKKFDVSVLSLQQAESLRSMLHIHTLDEYGMVPLDAIQGNAPEEWYKENPYPEKEPEPKKIKYIEPCKVCGNKGRGDCPSC